MRSIYHVNDLTAVEAWVTDPDHHSVLIREGSVYSLVIDHVDHGRSLIAQAERELAQAITGRAWPE